VINRLQRRRRHHVAHRRVNLLGQRHRERLLLRGDLHRLWENQALWDYSDTALPAMVQVGNEINAGMLWPDGSTSDWAQLAGHSPAGEP
jgi:arabinogalactan endo-1,4-beta-galactosidase